MSRFDAIPAVESQRNERTINVIVETPWHTRNKYAFNEQLDVFELRHTLRAGMAWPCNFGFVPQTRNDDGDPLDVALYMDEPIFTGCRIRARLLGCIRLTKNGVQNDRLVACSLPMSGTGLFTDDVKTLSDLPDTLVNDLENFLKVYSEWEGNKVKLKGRCQAAKSMGIVRFGMKAWRKSRD